MNSKNVETVRAALESYDQYTLLTQLWRIHPLPAAA
jgi:hypothetical protein